MQIQQTKFALRVSETAVCRCVSLPRRMTMEQLCRSHHVYGSIWATTPDQLYLFAFSSMYCTISARRAEHSDPQCASLLLKLHLKGLSLIPDVKVAHASFDSSHSVHVRWQFGSFWSMHRVFPCECQCII